MLVMRLEYGGLSGREESLDGVRRLVHCLGVSLRIGRRLEQFERDTHL